jgi:putative membrane protein
LQVAFPLVDEASRADLATATVLVFFLASVVHSAARYGALGVLMVGVVVPAVGLVAESIGVRTEYLFGEYVYGDVLRPMLFDAPVIVPLAWAMMAYPTFIVASSLTTSRWWAALIGGWSLMAWDIFLDPMMLDLGGWTWLSTKSSVPGLPDIPLQNFAGWLLVGTVSTALLTVLAVPRASKKQPATLYLWVYVSSVVGATFYFDRPSVAWIGGISMGLVAVPFAWRAWAQRT